MESEDRDISRETQKNQSISLDKLIEELERIDGLIKKKYTKTITVMFTDLKGSTSIGDSKGDIVSRRLIKKHNDIVLPIIAETKGVLVKTMGDGTLSYFDHAADAVSAAVRIQTEINNSNRSQQNDIPIELRIGLHTGTGIVEPNDIFGDVVNVASRFQSQADPGGIVISEKTYEALEDKNEFYCRHIKTTGLKGKKEAFKIFKVFWDEREIEQDKTCGIQPSVEDITSDTLFPPEIYGEVPALKEPATGAVSEDSILVQKARKLIAGNEFVELYLFCEEFMDSRSIQYTYQTLKRDLETKNKVETYLHGEKAIWFYKEKISVGRFPEADFPVTNQAFMRTPVIFGVRNGEAWLKVAGRGTGKMHSVELQCNARVETAKPDIEYPLGKFGKIIFASCFPFAYRFHKERFLVLSILNPEECFQRQFNIRLADIWQNFAVESERVIIIGR